MNTTRPRWTISTTMLADIHTTAPVAWLVTQMVQKMMIRKSKITACLFLLFLTGPIFFTSAQYNQEIIEGKISYITGESIYIKFQSTSGIENGDTLFVRTNGKLEPALVVRHQSSISCLCNRLNEKSFKVDDLILAKIRRKTEAQSQETESADLPDEDVNEQALTASTQEEQKQDEKREQDVNGRLQASSYSNFSNSDSDDSHRFRYTLSLDVENISNSKLSAETYISFKHKLNEWDVVKEDLNNALKIYNLALKYDFNENSTLWAGRKINPKIANVGAIDGIQFQQRFNHFFAGVAAGSKPDWSDYGYNIDLLEFGGYFGHGVQTKNGFVQTTLGFFEQRNHSKTDRRFVYFQHTNSAIKNLNLFSSFEIDLYKLVNDNPQNTLSLTSLYLSARYRFSRRLSVFGSYDNRKNVIYYETFRNYAEEVLQQASRQGFRLRINFRPINYLLLGINAGTRYRKNNPRPTNTLNGSASYSKIPGINARLTLNANLMQTSYLDGQVYGARLSKNLLDGKLYTMLHYRFVDFSYINSSTTLQQNIGEIDFSYHLNKKWYFSVNFETTFQNSGNYNRLYLNLRRRF